MKLYCSQCGESAERGIPRDVKPETPTDRKLYRHKIHKDSLCPEVGTNAFGRSSYVPCLPTNRQRK